MSELERALTAGRAEAEGLMRDTAKLYRPGLDVFDRETGETTAGPPVVVFYEGPVRIKPADLSDSEVQAGEQEVVLRQYRITLPYSTLLPDSGERPEPGDVVDVLASPEPRFAGVRLWVTGVMYSSTATAWRIIAEDRS